MIKVGDKFIIETESVMTNKNGVLYGIKGLYPLCISEEGIDGLEKFEEPLPVPMSSIEKAHNKGYEEGINETWKTAKKIVLVKRNEGLSAEELNMIFWLDSVDSIFANGTAAEAISKIKGYEEQKKVEEEIKVGDEIEYKLFGDDVKAVVIQVVEIDDGAYEVLCENGCGQVLYKTEQPIIKTGKHYDIDGILKAMREE